MIEKYSFLLIAVEMESIAMNENRCRINAAYIFVSRHHLGYV